MNGSDVSPSPLAALEALPRYQLHVRLSRLEPCVMPFIDDPNDLGAFVKLSDLEALLPALREAWTRGQERFDPTNHHNALTCPYCNPVEEKDDDLSRNPPPVLRSASGPRESTATSDAPAPMKHMPGPTPGPWTVESGYDSQRTVAILRDFRPVGNSAPTVNAAPWVHEADPEQIVANARLIAAAPDLLAALKSIVACFQNEWGDRITEGHVPADLLAEDVDVAMAAIAKAEGR